jgi:hypothetical protein
VKLHLSVDGLGEKNDYIRYGSDFAAFVDNIRTLSRTCPHVELEPATCVSLLNVLDLAEIHEYFRPMFGSHSFVNLLVDPPELRATWLPAELKEVAVRRLSRFPDVFRSQILWLQAAVDPVEQAQALSAFADRVGRIDRARGTSFRAVFPELAPCLGSPSATRG